MTDKSDQRAVATSNAAINATIKSIRTSTEKVRGLIQTGIVQCIEHANAYGDCTGAARLVDAIPQEMRRAEVVKHFAEYSPIRIVGQGRGKPMKASLRKETDAGYNAFNVEGAKANPWFERAAIARADDREMQPFDEEAARGRIVQLAGFIETKSNTVNKVKLDDNGSPVKDENGDYVRIVSVDDDDKQKLKAEAMLLRCIARDPAAAAKLLNLPKDMIKALSDVPEVEQPATEQPPVPRTGTNG